MAKAQLLVVEQDARDLRVLKVSLEQAGYEVATACHGLEALALMERCVPDAVVTASELPRLDGYGMVRRMREREEWAAIPIIFVTDAVSIADRIRGLELGVEDYLPRPVFVRDLLNRVAMLLAKRTRASIADGLAPGEGKLETRGRLSEISVLDWLDILDRGQATAVLRLWDSSRRAGLYFRSGKLVDAYFERLRGEEAVFRALVWPEARFELEFCEVHRAATVDRSTRNLIDAGLSHMAEWKRLVDALPPLTSEVAIDGPALRARAAEIPDQLHGVLQLLDGTRNLYDVLDESPFDDLSTLATAAKLHETGLLVTRTSPAELERPPESATLQTDEDKRDTHPYLDGEDEGAMSAVVADATALSERSAVSDRPSPQSPQPPPSTPPVPPKEPSPEPPPAQPEAEPSPEPPRAEPKPSSPPLADDQPSSSPPAATGEPTAQSGADSEPATTRQDFDEATADEAVDGIVAAQGAAAPDVPGVDTSAAGAGRVIVTPSRKAPTVAGDALPLVGDFADEPADSPPSSDKTKPSAGFPPPDDDASEEPPKSSDEKSAAADAEAKGPADEEPAAGAEPESAEARTDRGLGPTTSAEGGESKDEDDDEDDQDDDDTRSGREPKALSESGVSDGFFRSLPQHEEEEEEPLPLSEEAPVYLTEEQLERRNRMMKIVGAVIGIAVAGIVFIWLRGRTPDASETEAPRTSKPTPTAVQTISTRETATAGSTGGSAPDTAPSAAPTAEPDAGTEDAAADADVPDVEDPLKEARILANSGQLEKAIVMAKAAITKDPDDAEAYMYLAEAYRGTGQADKVQATYDECATRATKNVTRWCPQGRAQ